MADPDARADAKEAASRAKAAVPVLGGPKAQPMAFNRNTGKMEPKGKGAKAPTKGPARAPRAAPQKSWLEMNPKELLGFAKGQVQTQQNTERQPFQQRGKEIAGTEQTVANRFAGFGQTASQLMAGIQGGAEASAKTFENEAADRTLKAQGEVNTTGQGVVTNNAGQLEPGMAAQLASERGNVAGIGLAGQNRIAAQGQNESATMGALRAAAGQRVAEGQRGITEHYGALEAKNQGEEGRILQRKGGEVTKLFQNLSGQQEKFNLARAGLGLKGREVGSKEESARTKEGTERSKTQIEREKFVTDKAYKEASIADKTRLDESTIKDREAKLRLGYERLRQKPPSSAQMKALSELSGAYSTFERLRTANVPYSTIREYLTKGGERGLINVPKYYKDPKTGEQKKIEVEKSVLEHVPRVQNALLLNAAEEVWNTHKIGAATKAALQKAGVSPEGWEQILLSAGSSQAKPQREKPTGPGRHTP